MRNHDLQCFRVLLLAVALGLFGCDAKPTMIAPGDPPGVTIYERYPFGYPESELDHRAQFALLDQLEPRFGKVNQGKLDVDVRKIAADADLAAVRAYYERAAAERHLAPMPIAARAEVWALAFTDGEHVYAVQALTPDVDPKLKILPLTIVTNLGRPADSASPGRSH